MCLSHNLPSFKKDNFGISHKHLHFSFLHSLSHCSPRSALSTPVYSLFSSLFWKSAPAIVESRSPPLLLLWNFCFRKLDPSISGDGANADDSWASVGQFEAANVAKKCLLAAVKAYTRAAHLRSNPANAYFSMGDHRNASKCLEMFGFLDSVLETISWPR